jgi:hypothetical protein
MGRGAHPAVAWRMNDLAMIALTVVFFLLSWLYVRACGRI